MKNRHYRVYIGVNSPVSATVSVMDLHWSLSQEHFYSLTETERKISGPPQLTIQVYDSDVFSSDDYLGTSLTSASTVYHLRFHTPLMG